MGQKVSILDLGHMRLEISKNCMVDTNYKIEHNVFKGIHNMQIVSIQIFKVEDMKTRGIEIK